MPTNTAKAIIPNHRRNCRKLPKNKYFFLENIRASPEHQIIYLLLLAVLIQKYPKSHRQKLLELLSRNLAVAKANQVKSKRGRKSDVAEKSIFNVNVEREKLMNQLLAWSSFGARKYEEKKLKMYFLSAFILGFLHRFFQYSLPIQT